MTKPKTIAHKQALSRSLTGRPGKFKGKKHTFKAKQKISIGKSKYNMNFEKADQIRADFNRGMSRKNIAKNLLKRRLFSDKKANTYRLITYRRK